MWRPSPALNDVAARRQLPGSTVSPPDRLPTQLEKVPSPYARRALVRVQHAELVATPEEDLYAGQVRRPTQEQPRAQPSSRSS